VTGSSTHTSTGNPEVTKPLDTSTTSGGPRDTSIPDDKSTPGGSKTAAIAGGQSPLLFSFVRDWSEFGKFQVSLVESVRS